MLCLLNPPALQNECKNIKGLKRIARFVSTRSGDVFDIDLEKEEVQEHLLMENLYTKLISLHGFTSCR